MDPGATFASSLPSASSEWQCNVFPDPSTYGISRNVDLFFSFSLCDPSIPPEELLGPSGAPGSKKLKIRVEKESNSSKTC